MSVSNVKADDRKLIMQWLTSVSRNPIGLVLIGAVFALCLSSYPIIFFGKSYVSPGYGPQMLYDDLPYVPGYQSTDKEDLSADPGAMLWQNLPYSRVQHEAVFEHGEFPLWNRYNSGGLPLFGQGQSQILDPLHWIAVAGEGNGWAWDVKFLLSKLIFLAGIGASILLMTRNRLVSIVVMVSASFIGFFYFRFNHPIFFNLTYSSWLFFFYLHLVQDLQLSSSMRRAGWRVWPMCGVFATSLLLLVAGAPKEASIILGALHFAGFIGVVAASHGLRKLSWNIAVLLFLWMAIVLVSAPHWMIFLDTLSKVSTSSDTPSCYYFNIYNDFWYLIDTLFLGPKDRPWSEPNTNTFIFFTVLMVIVVTPRLFRRTYFWMVAAPLAMLLSISFGVVPESICQRIPLVGMIHHVNHTFLTAAIIFGVLLSGLGLSEFVADLKDGKGRVKWTIFVLAVGLLLVYWAYPYYDSYDYAFSAATMLASLSIGGVTFLLFFSIWWYRPGSGFSVVAGAGLVVLFSVSHGYHGLHLATGWEELDDLLINPTPRADLLKPSPAVDALGFLLPAKSFEIVHYEGESEDVCSVSPSSLIFEGYVNKYPDLFIAYNANPRGKSQSDWGRSHYCRVGRDEGRTIPEQVRIIAAQTKLDRARTSGAIESEIQKYEGDLKEVIASSRGQRHVANFLRTVGATRWPDGPARVLGEGRTPMSGFYSYLKLESLNGPDAIMNREYLEFLDLMGWRLKPRETWLRTMEAEDFEKFESLLDVLNVGYLMTWKRNLNIGNMVSEYVPYPDNRKTTGRKNLAGDEVWLSLRRMPVIADRVNCRPKGLQSDGRADNVFVADINLPNAREGKVAAISALRVERIRPSGVSHTGGPEYVLGVSKGLGLPLLNSVDGGVRIPGSGSSLRLWLFSCADGHDLPDSEYRLRVAYDRANPLPLVFAEDMKVWERKHPWPRAYFVDEISTYTSRDPYLVQVFRDANGLPLAAVHGKETVWPSNNRTVVRATDYQLTSNSTSFQVEAPTSGIVVLTEANIPGDVHVIVNGEPGEVITVNHAFRGVTIPETGSYSIKFFYRPRFWYLSWMLFGLGLTLFVFMMSSFGILNKRLTPVQ